MNLDSGDLGGVDQPSELGVACRGVVAAGHPLTAEAGAEMLRQGGNAFDAAIAAVMAAWVTEPVLTSPGGGGFLLAHTAGGENCLFDFFSQTPGQRPRDRIPDFYPIEANFGDAVQEFHIGLGSVAVPGSVAGLFQVHQRLGRLPLAAIAEPAIHYATHGIAINGFMAYCFNLLKPILTATPAAKAMYAPHGTLLTEGDTFTLPDLAVTLQDLVDQGPALFYEGALAQRLVQDCQTHGGYLTQRDLAQYRVLERSPLALAYRGNTLLTNPPPSSGGALIAFTLALLERGDWSQIPWGSPHHITALAQAMALTNTARRDGYDAHLHSSDVAQQFLSPDHLQPYHHAFGNVLNKWGSTTHVSVLDGEGNAASVTTSNGEGSAYVIPGTQIMLNNMLGEADLHPQGFHQWQPHQRISSMMGPTLVLEAGRPRLVLGSGGSNRIRTAIVQVVSNLLDFHMPLEEAVAAPRLHWEQGTLHLEPGYEADSLGAELSPQLNSQPEPLLENLCPWQQQNMFFGGVHAVAQTPDGRFSGAGDARRGGAMVMA